jgi:hypothetical protein
MIRCKGTTVRKTRCKSMTEHPTGLCRMHRKKKKKEETKKNKQKQQDETSRRLSTKELTTQEMDEIFITELEEELNYNV